MTEIWRNGLMQGRQWSNRGAGSILWTTIGIFDSDADGDYDSLFRRDSVRLGDDSIIEVDSIATDAASGREVTTSYKSPGSTPNTVHYPSLDTQSWGMVTSVVRRSDLSNYASTCLPSPELGSDGKVLLNFPKTSIGSASQMTIGGDFAIVEDDPWLRLIGEPFRAWAHGAAFTCESESNGILIKWPNWKASFGDGIGGTSGMTSFKIQCTKVWNGIPLGATQTHEETQSSTDYEHVFEVEPGDYVITMTARVYTSEGIPFYADLSPLDVKFTYKQPNPSTDPVVRPLLIAATPASISVQVEHGKVGTASMEIWNEDDGQVGFNLVASDPSWISASSSSGTATSVHQSISLSFDATSLPVGQHQGTISVRRNTDNSEQVTISVTLTVVPNTDGWVQWPVSAGGNGHWYKAVNNGGKLGWSQAKAAAEAAGGYLVCITSQEENGFVFSMINNNAYWWYYGAGVGPWIGGHYASGWAWVSGETFAFDNFAPNEPSAPGLAGGFMHFYRMTSEQAPASTWGDVEDNQYYSPTSYIIERSKYTIIPGKFTWQQAKADAEARGGHLATITSQAEWTAIGAQLHHSGSVPVCWIGGYQNTTAPDYSEPSGGWRWITGEPWSHTNWGSGEPSDSGSEEFLMINPTGTWNDIRSDGLLDPGYPDTGYILEME